MIGCSFSKCLHHNHQFTLPTPHTKPATSNSIILIPHLPNVDVIAGTTYPLTFHPHEGERRECWRRKLQSFTCVGCSNFVFLCAMRMTVNSTAEVKFRFRALSQGSTIWGHKHDLAATGKHMKKHYSSLFPPLHPQLIPPLTITITSPPYTHTLHTLPFILRFHSSLKKLNLNGQAFTCRST